MAFYSRKIISLVHGLQNYSRPFDEIVYSYDVTSTNNDQLCLGSPTTKDTMT